MPTDLTELIERVERHTGPNLATEISIAILLDTAPEGFKYIEETQGWQRYVAARDDVELWMPPAYTASLDAALALVERKLPDREWAVGRDDENRRCWASIDDDNWDEAMDRIDAYAKSAPLALILALLRALQSQSDREGRDVG